MLDRRFRGGRLGAAFAALGLIFIALTVWAGFLAKSTYAADTRKSDIAAAQEVARRVVIHFYEISYQTFDQDTQRVYADLDSAFKAQAVQQIGSTWKQTVVSNQLISNAALYASGVVNISSKSAEVLVTVTRTARSSQAKTPVSSRVSAQVQLTKRGDDWKVSGMGGLQ
ncbi:hypothetical protein GCM10023191_004710 [Actinoallomurus oryzae]|uniref:Mce-associated membrane protein n=2 Tax=Actinoallomurus oryzae TaxID=502180 RepID=A0ABP8PAX0_9ACTN